MTMNLWRRLTRGFDSLTLDPSPRLRQMRGQQRPVRRRDPLDCPRGRHTYEIPSTYPPGGSGPPGEPGLVIIHDCHCPASDPGHIHWAKVT